MSKSDEGVRSVVRRVYGRIATSGEPCCGEQSPEPGYTKEQLEALPDDALMGLGCGDPVGCAELDEGETVLDLGSGGGIDVFLAARQVGPTGRVIGIDMTHEMLTRARANAQRLGLENVEFREGLIEALPVADASADVILSNCVINLSPDKTAVFREAFRALRPGGRLVVSDIVAERMLPAEIKDDAELWASCIAGAIPEQEYLETIHEAGFASVEAVARGPLAMGYVRSLTVRATKAGDNRGPATTT